jgi:outer membrane protein OmpA-like peptidoglycan-associated protein/ABC-type nitrate/sulfonate/bicarbonate transport system substrate-binding protein
MITTKGKLMLTIGFLLIVAGGVWRWKDTIFPPTKNETKTVNVQELQKAIKEASQAPAPVTAPAAPAGSAKAAVTPAKPVNPFSGMLGADKDAKVIGASALPPVVGVSDYTKSMKNGKFVVNFPINVWPGWAPIIVANRGMSANDESVFFKKYGFYLELSIVDDPVKARDLFASGHTHVLWGTLDMFALFAPELCRDSRISPVIHQQIDFSAGGDGIVARNGVRSINDLGVMNGGVKRKVVLAQNSPSQYFIMALLIEAGVDPSRIDFSWAADAPAAAKLFVQDKSFDAFVGWSPDIYIVPDQVKSSRLIVSTGSANRLVSDVWAVRNDFNNDHPEIVEGLVRGIFEGMDMVRKDPKGAAADIAKAYGIPAEDCLKMIGKDGGIAEGDAHLTNYRENEKFFLNSNNPANFEVIWTRASKIYQALGYITEVVPASKVKGTVILTKIADFYKDSTDLSQRAFNFKDTFAKGEQEESQILTKTVTVSFRPSQFEIDESYDKNIQATLEEIGKLSATFGSACISIEGNTDGSLKGTVPADLVKKLSYDRAESVKSALINKYKFRPDQFRVVGNGWDNPIAGCNDPTNKEHNKKNRRVEVKVYPLEAD